MRTGWSATRSFESLRTLTFGLGLKWDELGAWSATCAPMPTRLISAELQVTESGGEHG